MPVQDLIQNRRGTLAELNSMTAPNLLSPGEFGCVISGTTVTQVVIGTTASTPPRSITPQVVTVANTTAMFALTSLQVNLNDIVVVTGVGNFRVVDTTKLTGYQGYAAVGGLNAEMQQTVNGLLMGAGANSGIQIGLDANAIGYNATAIGNSTTASGYYATASGYYTTASSTGANAIGKNATASGYYANAIGASANASGDYTNVIGYNATASGTNANAIGASATAIGYYTNAIGASAKASGLDANAIGASATASGTNATAIGSYVNALMPNMGEFGQWSSPIDRLAGIQLRGGDTNLKGMVAFTFAESATAPVDTTAAAGSEPDGTLARGMATIQLGAGGTTATLYANIAGTIKSFAL